MKAEVKKLVVLSFLMIFFIGRAVAQNENVGINNTGASPDASAMLDVSSTTKGFLPPRMTGAQRGAIASPAAGLIIWCSNCGVSGELQVYNGTAWTNLIGGVASGLPGAPVIGTAEAGNMQALVPFTAPASNGGSTIVSYTATSTPGGITGTLNQAGSGTITVSGLTNGVTYTFAVTATNATGTGAASSASNSVTPAQFTIGQSYGGGVIFYIDGTGLHGLIAATADQSTGISWAKLAYQGTSVPGGTSNAIGTGSVNTDRIIAQNGAGVTYAAGLARSYAGGGFQDWFLPAMNELNLMFVKKLILAASPTKTIGVLQNIQHLTPHCRNSIPAASTAAANGVHGMFVLSGPFSS